MTLDVGVVGCGYAGGTAGLLLARMGHRVRVYECVPEPGPVGAGILLQPTGMQVLAELGLVAPVLARGGLVQRLEARTARRRRLLGLDYGALGPGFFGVGLHRGVLFESLYQALIAEPSSDVLCGVEIERAEMVAGGRLELVTRSGERHGPHDLLVIADGARSDVTIPAAPTRRVKPYPWGALWAVLQDRTGIFAGELHQVVRGTRTMLGFLPTGLGPASDPGAGTPLVSMFWSLRMTEADAVRAEGLEAFKAKVLELEPRAEPLLAQIHDMETLIAASYRDVYMPSYHSGRVVYLGDAAHAMSPQLGQGANLALYDAWVLAQCVAALGDHPAAAVAEYTRRRRPHLGYYQWANRFLTPFFQSDAWLRGWLRDTFMPVACAIPPLRQQMIATMAGIQLGIFGRRIDVTRALPEVSCVGAPVPTPLLEAAGRG